MPQIPSRKSSDPDTDPTQGKTRAPTLGPHFTQEETRAQVFGPRFHPGENSGPGARGQIPWVPISRVPARPHALVLQSPPLPVISGVTMLQLGLLSGRYRLGLTSIARDCRSLRESLWGFPPYLAPKSSLATRWPDATEYSGGIYPPRIRVLLSGQEVARRHGVKCWYCSAHATWD